MNFILMRRFKYYERLLYILTCVSKAAPVTMPNDCAIIVKSVQMSQT